MIVLFFTVDHHTQTRLIEEYTIKMIKAWSYALSILELWRKYASRQSLQFEPTELLDHNLQKKTNLAGSKFVLLCFQVSQSCSTTKLCASNCIKGLRGLFCFADIARDMGKLAHLYADENCAHAHMNDMLWCSTIVARTNITFKSITKRTVSVIKISKIIISHPYTFFYQISLQKVTTTTTN